MNITPIAPAFSKAAAQRTITILGSTGSIGCSTLRLIEAHRDAYRVEVLTAHRNVPLLIEQARQFRPRLVALGDAAYYEDVKAALSPLGITVTAGETAVTEAAAEPTDWLISGIVGAAALAPTLAAIRRGGTVALANKECLVCAGDLVMAEAARTGATILPVDSEHSAIFQIFEPEQADQVEAMTLTASGGPFWQCTREQMQGITPEQAVRHPNWQMGAKISVDSATMMNKGLELIEAYHLFPVSAAQLQVVVHPESIVHGLVHYRDGSVKAQLSPPDMITPIAVALAWPARIPVQTARLDLATLGKLTFHAPDDVRFPALRLAREALQTGGSAPAVLNAANEEAVKAFLDGKIGFLHIVEVVDKVLDNTVHKPLVTIEEVVEVDAQARNLAREAIHQHPR